MCLVIETFSIKSRGNYNGKDAETVFDIARKYLEATTQAVTDFPDSVKATITDSWAVMNVASQVAKTTDGAFSFNADSVYVFGLNTSDGAQYTGINEYLTDEAPILNFIEKYIMPMHLTAVIHDAWVNYLVVERGYSFNSINIVTMLPAYFTALALDMENTGRTIVESVTVWKNTVLE